jgi:hypothetical protein
MLNSPDLRAAIGRYLEHVQAILELEVRMDAGDVTPHWLAIEAHLAWVDAACYAPTWPPEAQLFPLVVQAWVLAVDDAVRHWQLARRQWLGEACGLQMMPVVAGHTPLHPTWHDVEAGRGAVVLAVVSPGFLLGGDVRRKARVRT